MFLVAQALLRHVHEPAAHTTCSFVATLAHDIERLLGKYACSCVCGARARGQTHRVFEAEQAIGRIFEEESSMITAAAFSGGPACCQ